MLHRLDDKERQIRMRLAADKAEIQRVRSAVRSDRYRQQLMLQEQSEEFVSSRKDTMVMKGLLPDELSSRQHVEDLQTRYSRSTSVARVMPSGVQHRSAAHARTQSASAQDLLGSALKAGSAEEIRGAGEEETKDLYAESARGGDDSYGSDFESMTSEQLSMMDALVSVISCHMSAAAIVEQWSDNRVNSLLSVFFLV